MVSGPPQRTPNRLADSKSPYLRLHSMDPVDWYPWGEEAFRRAREEDKPILLSIGYSSCHWCHVMQRESFMNPVIADIINRYFIPVKVDREERPDVDAVYMRAVLAMAGSGGWPLTVFLTPDLKPFYGGTYFPPERRGGLPSFKEVLLAVKDAWERRRVELLGSGSGLFEIVTRALSIQPAGEVELRGDIMDAAFDQIVLLFDDEYGGLRGAPKFPTPTIHLFLLRYWRISGEDFALKMVQKTLRSMFTGGIYDHAGGGFHRYSVDRFWGTPHFEKMLYDNSMLLRLYAEAYVASRDSLLRYIARDTALWLLSELKAPSGGFYSSLSAESGGVEGGYYLFSWEEVSGALGEEVARLLGCSPSGNFAPGLNVLRLPRDPERLGEALGMRVEDALDYVRRRLSSLRRGREKPDVDDKIIAAWNGLAVYALSYAAPVLSMRELIDEASRAAEFVLRELYMGERLARYYRNGPSEAPGTLEDYALLGLGLLDLYEWGGMPGYLEEAEGLASDILDLFSSQSGGFYDVPPDADIPVRPMKVDDNAYPSGYSASVQLLARLHLLTGKDRYREAALSAIRRVWQRLQDEPVSHTSLIQAIPLFLGRGGQIVVASPGDPWEDLMGLASRVYEPYIEVSAACSEATRMLWEGKTALGGKTAFYFCRGFKCLLPTTSLEELESFIKLGH